MTNLWKGKSPGIPNVSLAIREMISMGPGKGSGIVSVLSDALLSTLLNTGNMARKIQIPCKKRE